MVRTKIPDKEWKVLLVNSGGICAMPGCGESLVKSGGKDEDDAFIGEKAHIVAQSRQGPRGHSVLTAEGRDKHENLVLLCPNCHDRVDKQPRTFSVSVLQRIKQDHEEQMAKLAGRDSPLADRALVGERLYSTLLPVTHLPDAVFAAECEFTDRQEKKVKSLIQYPKDSTDIIRFLIRERTLFSFSDLRDPTGPFSKVIDSSKVKKVRSAKFFATPEGHRRFMTLINRSLYKFTARLGLQYDPLHYRYFFPVLEPGVERSVDYRPLNVSTCNRNVAWEEKFKKTGEGKGFWWHLAAALRIQQMSPNEWCLSIRPERHLTVDGTIPLASDKIGRKVTRLKANMFNDKYLSEINFWRDYLSDGAPRFELNYGSQAMVISTEFLNFDVSWAGIPGDDKPFKNVVYEDDLFSFSSLERLNSGEDDDDWDDDSNFEEGEFDDIDSTFTK